MLEFVATDLKAVAVTSVAPSMLTQILERYFKTAYAGSQIPLKLRMRTQQMSE